MRRELVGWLPVIEYCAEECRRQRVSPLHVGYMVDAWRQAQQASELTVDLIVRLGATIEPQTNTDWSLRPTFRRYAVMVGDKLMPPWQNVSRLVEALVDAQDRLTPAEFYLEFEKIHPFGDGNGRTGKVLFNMLNGTLDAPVWPPDFFGTENF